MKRVVPVLVPVLLLLFASCPAVPAIAGDDQVPPPRVPGATPTPVPTPAIDEERLAELVDAAVERAMARRVRIEQAQAQAQAQPAAYGPSASGQAPVYAAPQQVAGAAPVRVRTVRRLVAAAPAETVVYQPVLARESRYARVLVPPSRFRMSLGLVGEKLVECGRPRARLLQLAPAEVSESVEYEAAPPSYAVPVRSSPQAPGK